MDSQLKALFNFAACGKLWLRFCFSVTPAFAQENATAYEACAWSALQLSRDALNHVMSVTGVEGRSAAGNMENYCWKILTRGGVREVEVADGRIDSERRPGRVRGRFRRRRDDRHLAVESRFQRRLCSGEPHGGKIARQFRNGRVTPCARTNAANRSGS